MLPVYNIEPSTSMFEKRNSYGELTAAYYIWKHPEVIKDKKYIGI